MEDILGEVEQSLQQPALQEAACLLQSIPGIGTKTTATLLREYGSDALNYSIKEWESFADLDVIEWTSGTSVRKNPESASTKLESSPSSVLRSYGRESS